MFIDGWLEAADPVGKQALVFSAGGGADIILARVIADRLRAAGAQTVDLAQPLNRLEIEKPLAEQFRMSDLTGSAQVLRLDEVVPNDSDEALMLRGRGIAIAAAIDWRAGDRLIFAPKGDGCSLLANRAWAEGEPYDLAIAVDGGGDILTGDSDNFDRVVLDRFRETWDSSRRLALVVIGLGADGGSSVEQFRGATMDGWSQTREAFIDLALCDEIEDVLASINRLHPNPLYWRDSDPHWAYSLHVPQIIALAGRSMLPASARGGDYVLAPRKGEMKDLPNEIYSETGRPWIILNKRLLQIARWYDPIE